MTYLQFGIMSLRSLKLTYSQLSPTNGIRETSVQNRYYFLEWNEFKLMSATICNLFPTSMC